MLSCVGGVGETRGQETPTSLGIADPPPLTHKLRLDRICPCDLYAAQGLVHVCEELDALAVLYK